MENVGAKNKRAAVNGGVFSKTGRSIRYTYRGSLAPQSRASAIDLPAQRGRSMAYSWWVAEMAAGGFRKRGGRCGIPTRGQRGLETALLPSTTPPNAGGGQ